MKSGISLAFGDTLIILKGFLYVLILAYVSFKDLMTKNIPDRVHILIILLGLINLNPLNSITGFIFVPIPFFITALIKSS